MSVPAGFHQAKLRSLARELSGVELALDESPGQAGGFARVAGGPIDAYLLQDDPDRPAGVGAALRWFERLGGDASGRLNLLTNADAASTVARRAGHFDVRAPELRVYAVAGTTTEVAIAEPVPAVPELSSEVWSLAGLINECGARAVDDHGRLVAEVAGLEVARVDPDGPAAVDVEAVIGADLSDPDDVAAAAAINEFLEANRPDGPVIEVGVGQADRELHQLVHADLSADEALRRVVALVGAHRRAGARPHPLNRLARERLLRSVLLDDPTLVGLGDLEAVAPLEGRSTLLGMRPVAAIGRVAASPSNSARGPAETVVVCAVGVDLELGPTAADYRQRHAASDGTLPGLIVVVPESDRYRLIEHQVALLDRPDAPARLESIPNPWSASSGS